MDDEETGAQRVKHAIFHEYHGRANLAIFLGKSESSDESVTGGGLRGVRKWLELMLELFDWHPDRKAVSPDINSGHHTAVAQLRVDEIAIKVCRG